MATFKFFFISVILKFSGVIYNVKMLFCQKQKIFVNVYKVFDTQISV